MSTSHFVVVGSNTEVIGLVLDEQDAIKDTGCWNLLFIYLLLFIYVFIYLHIYGFVSLMYASSF